MLINVKQCMRHIYKLFLILTNKNSKHCANFMVKNSKVRGFNNSLTPKKLEVEDPDFCAIVFKKKIGCIILET